MTTAETKARMIEELDELDALVNAAPADHPAKIALAKIRGYIEDSPRASWFQYHENFPVKTLANMVAKGDAIFTPLA